MAAFKYAFIMNSQALTPETYHGILRSESIEAAFYGVNSLDMVKDMAKRLAETGVEAIDLCGDFDEASAKEVQEAAGGQTVISCMKYLPAELKKLESLESMANYGIIIIDEGFLGRPGRLVLPSDEFTTFIAGAGSLGEAAEAAAALAAEGIDFIELCSGFDEEMAGVIIERLGGRVPVGFAG